MISILRRNVGIPITVLAGPFLLSLIYVMIGTVESSRNVQMIQAHPYDDEKLTLYALGSLKGRFDVDEEGRGGIAALHTLVQRTREIRGQEGGGVLLLHGGDMTGAHDSDELLNAIAPPEVNIIRYMGFNVIAPSPTELDIISHWPDRDFLHLPAVSYNLRKALIADGHNGPIRSYRIVPVDRLNVFVTAITGGTEPLYDSDPYGRLKWELNRQTGADLFVILHDSKSGSFFHQDPQNPENGKAQNVVGEKMEKTEENYFEAETDTVTVNIQKMDEEIYEHQLFGPIKDEDPVSLPENPFPSQKTITIVSGAEDNRFYRLTHGSYVCTVRSEFICEVEYLFRRGYIIGINQRFFRVNDQKSVSSWIKPDPFLMKVLKK